MLNDSPARLARAHALCDLVAALRRANRASHAREPLRGALELARAAAPPGSPSTRTTNCAPAGEKVRRYTPFGVESLTPSERRVAELAAAGMTNRQVAQELYVTSRRSRPHLSAVYDKLGIRSRRLLADALRDDARGSLTR